MSQKPARVLTMNKSLYGWTIEFNRKPIPDRQFDYEFSHENYDGADGGNGLCGTGSSLEDCRAQIREIELDLLE